MISVSPVVLIVEDEKEIRRFVRAALEHENCRVFESETLQRGLIEAGTRKPDLIILDLGLPDGDGLDFIRDLRQWSSIPIIVLSARVSEEDKVSALDAGAEDYLVKPFGVSELMARVRVACAAGHTQLRKIRSSPLGNISVDLINRQVTDNGEIIHLTPIEFRLLTELVASPGKFSPSASY
ncbi:KDP operon transcriptional regulatory protein KdpE [Budvicia aquatica]|uniref:KDP operon transcriptional regulatory protein KdpE n=1 Tax=Budvicia aquatica TaxID=82979 RepID=A0A484ZAN8_9GAMM|nr:KDP operon transcriptional regulatory protein KdpE [Budvicia aquatica]